MKLSLALFVPFAAASQQRIAGYEPGSQVTDHNAIDLDQDALEKQLGFSTAESFQIAQDIYEQGAHSKAYAEVTLDTPLTSAVSKGAAITGYSTTGSSIETTAYSAADASSSTLKIKYQTFDSGRHNECSVGALPVADQYKNGCFAETGNITVGGNLYSYSYNPEVDNKNGRTIAGFSTSAEEKQLNGCPGCPYKEFKKYYDYYGVADYAHEWITAAFDGTETEMQNGNADFSKYGFTGRRECAKKGTAYMSIYMYVIREFEDAIDDCDNNSINDNYGSVHAWDEGVAFYSGTKVGVFGDTSGKLIYTLADKRCANFKTCGMDGDELEGTSYINEKLFELFTLGQYHLLSGQCEFVRPIVDEIVDLMSVPLVQGTLRYAYKVDKLEGAEKEKAEGAVFAASVIPRVHACNEDDAATIYDNMKVGASSTDFAAVQKAFEDNYGCMGINGALVGGLWNDALNDYYEGAEPKRDSSNSRNNLAIGLGVAFGVVGVVGLGFIVHMIRREKQGKPVFSSAANDGVDV